jgi:hypothetical protein
MKHTNSLPRGPRCPTLAREDIGQDESPFAASRVPPLIDDEPIPDTLRVITPEDAARTMLNGVAGDLGRAELRLLTRIARRLRVGRLAYGPCLLRSKEARQEIEDALLQLACGWVTASARDRGSR